MRGPSPPEEKPQGSLGGGSPCFSRTLGPEREALGRFGGSPAAGVSALSPKPDLLSLGLPSGQAAQTSGQVHPGLVSLYGPPETGWGAGDCAGGTPRAPSRPQHVYLPALGGRGSAQGACSLHASTRVESLMLGD